MNAELEEKVRVSVERLKMFEPKDGYYLAFSGGKDSVVCKALCDLAGVKYDAHYRVTSVDPPELVRFIKDKHPDVEFSYPRYPDGKRITMWNLIIKKQVMPTRWMRYCCAYLKEDAGDGRIVITGVRWAESNARKTNQGSVVVKNPTKEVQESADFKSTKRGGVILVNDNTESRRLVEQCVLRSRVTVNPIIEWSDDDVWNFINARCVPYCNLYDNGWTRIGCIGCPLAPRKARVREFAAYPIYEKNYKRAMHKLLEMRRAAHKDKTPTDEDYWNWWMDAPVSPGQISMDGFEWEGVE